MAKNLIFAWIFLLVLTCTVQTLDILPNHVKKGSGTFMVNGIFPITDNDGKINRQVGIMMSEAMKWAVNQVNKKHDYLHGYQLGIKNIFNSFKDDQVRRNVLDTFMEKVPFLIGPYSAETSFLSSILTTTFQQVAISYSATYSDFDLHRSDDNKMLRTIPSDSFRVMAALSLVRDLKWNYIAVVSSYGYDGERESLHFTAKLSIIGTCVAAQIDLVKYPTAENYKTAIEMLTSDFRLKAVVLFTTNKDTRNIIKTLKKMGLTDRFYLVCMYGCTNYINVVEENEEVADGTLSLDINTPEAPAFKEYFLNKTPDKDYTNFNRFWEDVFKCSLTEETYAKYKQNCTRKEQLEVGKGYYPNTPVHTVIEAVFHLAKAIKGFIEIYCHHTRVWMKNVDNCTVNTVDRDQYTRWIYKLLLKKTNNDGTLLPFDWSKTNGTANVQYVLHRFTFKNRVAESQKVWEWKVERSKNNETSVKQSLGSCDFFSVWYNVTNSTYTQEQGTCSKECSLGHIREYDQNSLRSKCCWGCRQCPRNNRVVNNTCIACKPTEVVGPQIDECVQMVELRINWHQPIVLFFVISSIIGISLTLFVALIFLYYNDNCIVRASGRDLLYIILLGICGSFACSFVFILETSQTICMLRGGLPGFCFLTCYAPLFLKTIRIYRIFVGAQHSVSRPALVSMSSQFVALFLILSTQLLISVVWFTSKVPMPELSVADDHITKHCSVDTSPILFFLKLLLSVIFMLSCTVLAFKTRHFPKNFNEAKFIGITLYITCVGWAVFLPIYFLSGHIQGEFIKELLMCGVCTFIGYVTLFGLFGYKVKLLLCGPIPVRQDSNPTWYIPTSARSHSKSTCSSYSYCECNKASHSPKDCCEELNGLSEL